MEQATEMQPAEYALFPEREPEIAARDDGIEVHHLLDYFPEATVLAGLFDRMRWAEEEIEAYKRKVPRWKVTAIDGAFRHLCWPGAGHVPEQIYRHHAREILSRVENGLPVEPATRAEILWHMHTISLGTPLNQRAAALYERLFEEIVAPLPEGMEKTPEPWEGASMELLAQLQNELRKERGNG